MGVVLLHQFHDILPGSSIAWVHRDAERNYAASRSGRAVIIAGALAALAGAGGPQLSFNAAPHARDGVPALGAPVSPVAAMQAVKADRVGRRHPCWTTASSGS